MFLFTLDFLQFSFISTSPSYVCKVDLLEAIIIKVMLSLIWESNIFCNFISTVWKWYLHVRFLSIQTSKNFIEGSCSVVNPFMFRFGSRNGVLTFFDDLWRKENLVFLTFNDNLLALNQLLTFINSLFIFSNKMLMSLCEKKRFVLSANMIGFSTFEAWCKSFTYNRNNKGPHVTVTF